MSSEEEFNARSLLQEMQTRLAEGPHIALGLPNHATPSDIRSAFLQLTKTFHPARFGRMATDIQRLSNEVFLSLRAAHDLLAKPRAPAPTRSGSTTAIPPMTSSRPATKPFGVPITPATRPGVAPTTPRAPADRPSGHQLPVRPSSSGTTPPPRVTPPPNPANPATSRTVPIPVTRTAPTSQQPPQAKPPQHASRPTPSTGVTFSTGPQKANAAPVRAVASSSTSQTLDPAIAPFLETLGRGQWDQALAMIDALAARNPQNKRYAALAAYARGRRAQVEGNMRDAQIELNQALMIDPELELARIAVAEMYKARK